jgi:hypothetical protein
MKYQVILKETREYCAREVAEKRQTMLDASYYNLHDSVIEAENFAKSILPSDEIGSFYTISIEAWEE